MTRYYPVFLDLEDKPCVVIGGGHIAARKIEGLLTCGASVTVIAPHAEDRIEALARTGAIMLKKRMFHPGDTRDASLVFAATDDSATNRAVAEDATRNGVLHNVVDASEWCSFLAPATVRRGDLCLAISTGGRSPALARKLREELEETYGEEYGEWVELLGEIRETVQERFSEDPEQRRAIFHQLVHSDLLALLRAGRREEARRRIEACLSSALG